MFDKLHLLSQDVPEGGDGFRWRAHPYLRMAGALPRGPAVFEWSARQRADLEALWRDPTVEGPRERLAKDLATFCDRLGWTADPKQLEDAEKRGEEYMLTLSAVAPELYILPWEVVQVGAGGTYLSDYASAQVRYAMPGLEPRAIATAPPQPGVLFAWSGAGGAVPHEEQAAAIREATAAGGVTFRELADVDQVSLQAALDAGPPSVLHLLCHGLPGPEGEPSRISWGAVDNPSEITATRLARMLRRHDDAIRLVVLSTCGSGDGRDNPMLMGSLAQELHKKGIPSVVASRYPLSVCGSGVMTRALYGKLLREAWSLERALRYTRDALLNIPDHGEMHPGDAYGIQLYAYDTERFVSDNRIEAERPVLASYPFGTAARPVPASPPPATELTLAMEGDPALSEDELVDKLRRVSEDDSLTVAIPLDAGGRGGGLSVHTTVDGAQRLLGAWRSKTLQAAVGVIVGQLLVTKGITPALNSLMSSAASKVGAAGSKAGSAAARAGTPTSKVATAGKVGTVARRAGTPTSQVGTTAKAGTAVGQATAAGTGNAATAATIAGKAVSAKIAIAALVGGAAVAGGAVVYRTQTESAAAPRPELTAAAPRPELTTPGSTIDVVAMAPSEPAGPAAREDEPPPPAPRDDPPTPPPDPPAAPVATPVAASIPHVVAVRTPRARPATAPARPMTPPAVPAPAVPAAAVPAPAVPAAAAPAAAVPAAAAPTAARAPAAVAPSTGATDGSTEAPPAAVSSTAQQRLSIADHNGHRISGETQILPSKQTRNQMISDGVTGLTATAELCVAPSGSVTEAKMTASTGYADYDQLLLAAVRRWRYRPYSIEGTPEPVCSEVEFQFRFE